MQEFVEDLVYIIVINNLYLLFRINKDSTNFNLFLFNIISILKLMEYKSVYQCSLDKTDCPLCCSDFDSENNLNQSTKIYDKINNRKVCTRYLDKSNSHKGICQEFLPQVELDNISNNCFDTYIIVLLVKRKKCNGEMCSINSECKSLIVLIMYVRLTNTDLVYDSKIGKYYCNSLESNKKLSNANCDDCNNHYLIKEKYIIGKVIDVSKENRKAFYVKVIMKLRTAVLKI